MKILQVVPYFYPAWAYGGPAKVVYEISKKLVTRGHNVTVYTTDVYDRDKRLDVDNNIPVNIAGTQTYYFRNIIEALAYDYNIFLSPKLVSVAKKEMRNFDVVHLHEYFTFQNVVMHHYAKKYDIPYVLNVHGSLCPVRQRKKAHTKKVFTHLFGKHILNDVDRAIALTMEEKKQFLMMGVDKDKIRVIPNGLDLSEFTDLPKKGTFKEKYSISSHTQIILFLGRVQKIKGLDLLINVFSKLIRKEKNSKLVIVGPEEEGYIETLKKLIATQEIEGKVLFTGLLKGQDKLSAYVDADVFVLSSYSEGLPMTVLEACASGLPVVITNRCNVPEVADYGAGLVVQCNENELFSALLHLLRDEGLRKTFGENGKRMVREKFTWDEVVKQLEEVYRKVGEKTGP